MNSRSLRYTMLALFLALAMPAFAHDPKEHAREAAAAKAGPDCTKLRDMDTSKMDRNDPVLLAMQAKCAGHMDDAAHDGHEEGKDGTREHHEDGHEADQASRDGHGGLE
ncbi:MAG TPA: hypothetical protein PKC03_16625 [Dokdonella sp.]|jgi:hypothetical protein|nr:hypothetical protein [Dokdonella sp.]